MKRFLICIAALLASAAIAAAQTPEEIIARMDAEMSKSDQAGLAVTLEIKIPIIGKTGGRIYNRGEKSRVELSVMDVTSTMWSDNVTNWTYTPKDNELVIENSSSNSSQSDNLGLFEGITAGYDVKLTKQTSDAWYFDCKKSKTNTDKDDPKKMTLVVSKANYMPLELSTTVKGIGVSMKDAVLGVSEEDVTFNMSKIPAGVKVTDKR